jgi:hypothetical protein
MQMDMVNGWNMNMKWQKHALAAITLAIPLLITVAARAQQQPGRPNIVVIWGDDIGF